MTVCEAITDKLIDDLTGNLTDTEKAEVDRHIVTCETCRRESETLRQMWTIMGSIEPTMSEHQLGNQPRAATREKPSRVRWWWSGIAASVALGVFVGYQAGRSTQDTPAIMDDGSTPYLLLLRQAQTTLGPTAPPESTLVREYGEWAADLSTNGTLLAGEALDDDATRFVGPDGEIDSETGRQVAPYISGFFLVSAPDIEGAVRTAQSSPHLGYGGWVEVHPTSQPPR